MISAYEAGQTASRLYLIKETSTNAAMREAATEAVKQLQEWGVGLDYREDVYRAVKAYADTQPKLAGEEAKLLAETMRDYRRAGLALPKPSAMKSSVCARNWPRRARISTATSTRRRRRSSSPRPNWTARRRIS